MKGRGCGREAFRLFIVLAFAIAASSAWAQSDFHGVLAAKGFDEEWLRRFEESWAALQARGELSRQSIVEVAALVRPEWLPEDPASAAEELRRTAESVEIQRRRGEPLWRIRLRLRHELEQRGRSMAEAAKKLGAGRDSGKATLETWRAAKSEGRPEAAGSPGSGGTGPGTPGGGRPPGRP